MEYTNNTNETEYVEMSKHSNYTKTNLIVAFLMGIIIGVGGYYLFNNSEVLNFSKKKDVDIKKDAQDIKNSVVKEDVGVKDTNNSVGINKKVSSISSITVSDQLAGLRVVIDSVTLAGSAWVAVREDREGKLGNILGAQRFDSGTHKGLVDLSRNTVEGGVYYVVLYADDGDKVFDYKKDVLITNESGDIIKSKFNAIRIR